MYLIFFFSKKGEMYVRVLFSSIREKRLHSMCDDLGGNASVIKWVADMVENLDIQGGNIFHGQSGSNSLERKEVKK